jgi:hypothetical protein
MDAKKFKMSSKRKSINMTIVDKVDTINLLRNGNHGRQIARVYSVEAAIASYIKKNSESIQLLVSVLKSENGSSSGKSMQMAHYVKVEALTYLIRSSYTL